MCPISFHFSIDDVCAITDTVDSLDLFFWYDSAFGSPVARVQGIGYIQEMIARLTHTPIAVHNSSTNATLDDNPATFPLGQSLYVDATHEVVVLNSMLSLSHRKT